MRGWVLISVLALAGCGEHLGVNPNYRFGNSPYGEYLAEREAALVSNGEGPAAIPLARPFEAPGPDLIAGRDPVPVPATMGVKARRSTTVAASTPAAPVATPVAVPVSRNAPLAVNNAPYPGSVPVLAQYAAQTRHAPGQAVYARTRTAPPQATGLCGGFASPETAQIAFLASGGPQSDPRGMDPDGDGFVCGWDPRPLRRP